MRASDPATAQKSGTARRPDAEQGRGIMTDRADNPAPGVNEADDPVHLRIAREVEHGTFAADEVHSGVAPGIDVCQRDGVRELSRRSGRRC